MISKKLGSLVSNNSAGQRNICLAQGSNIGERLSAQRKSSATSRRIMLQECTVFVSKSTRAGRDESSDGRSALFRSLRLPRVDVAGACTVRHSRHHSFLSHYHAGSWLRFTHACIVWTPRKNICNVVPLLSSRIR